MLATVLPFPELYAAKASEPSRSRKGIVWVSVMDAGPVNAAAVIAREIWAGMADPNYAEDVLPSRLAPGYVREDRRRLVAVPPDHDAEGIAKGIRVWHDLADGVPEFITKRIVAVSGERLAIAHHAIVLPDQTSTEMLILVQLDAECDLTDRILLFDAVDEESAIVVMEEWAAAIAEHDGRGPEPAT